MNEGERHQFQSVSVIGLDILHDISVLHQFCDGRKIMGVYISQDAKEFQDIWVG